MTWLRRARRAERLDAPELDRAVLERSLGHVAAVDRLLGGARALRLHLDPVVRTRSRGHIVDLGTGNAEVLRNLVAWARRTGGTGWHGTGVDLHPDVLAVARRARRHGDGTALLRADALQLPLADDSAEVVTTILTLHHFGTERAVAFVREMARVARHRVLVSDLERSLLHYLGARLLAATWWVRNPVTRHDGPLSVRRSFTSAELAEVGRRAGLREVQVSRHPVFRLIMTGTP